MKRVMLLVLLIVSLVELDWERDRIYLLSSLASLLLVVCSERLHRRKVQKATTGGALTAEQVVSPETRLAYLPHPRNQTYVPEMVEPPTTGEVAFMHGNSR